MSDITMKHSGINTGSLRVTDDESKAVQKTPNRISLDALLERVESVEYLHPKSIPHLTIAVVITENGFALVGKTAPADPQNYDEKLGEKFAYEDAVRQLWPLEAYLLREQMTKEE